MTETPQFITPAHVADRLGVSRSAVLAWCRGGSLRAFKTPGVKGQYRISTADLDAFIAERMTRTP